VKVRVLRRKGVTDIVYANLITLSGLHLAVRWNMSLVNDEFWNIRVRGGGEGGECKNGQPFEGQHDSG